ncbi:hypothetical protein SO802_016387 [Lithocarpus litseifolius]|uniref:Reverse transcriptase zinc-binding domain-containing protein n=1 Tax=Lithocarpus litseifolius TaxID=425828 RepID=A0AAW2CX31_9ROSI
MVARVASVAPPSGLVESERDVEEVGESINSISLELNAKFNEKKGYVTNGFHLITGLENARVASLFDTSHQVWNSDTLQLIFSPRDVDLIQSIPLSSKLAEDVFVWPFTLMSSYTLKSGYRFLYKSRSLDNNEYQPEDNTLWKKVWGLQAQPKVLNFLWRAIKNSIPTKLNLRCRMILVDDHCEQCNGATEEVLHALWSCLCLSQVWS